ncbi:MAG TPA: UPF0175 family protein [Bryobacteraceae bacterium]|jgi:hypothetical protein|nr:UPF0175 family protein [Bryobacteraceae bacterium]
MEVTLQIPDVIAPHLTRDGGDLSRVALEALRAGRITETQLRKMLGLARIELDGFLKAHGIYQEYTLEDLSWNGRPLKNWDCSWCGW